MDKLRITKLFVSNVGPFEEIHLVFPARSGINLICGDNGIGKSTILESLAAPFSKGGLTNLKKKHGSEGGEIIVSCVVSGNEHNLTVPVKNYEPDKSDHKITFNDYDRWMIFARTNREITYAKLNAISSDPSFEPYAISERVSLGIPLRDIKNWIANRILFGNHYYRSNEYEYIVKNTKFMKSVISILDSNFSFHEVDPKTFEIKINTPTGVVPFEYLSSGFKSAYILIIGVLKEIEYRTLGVSAELFSGVILIDEIELHLHPTWQCEISSILKEAFPNAQIIATTHSPHVIQRADPSEVIALYRKEDGSTDQRPLPSSEYGYAGWTLEEVLEDIMGVSDTKSSVFRAAIHAFDSAIDNEDCEKIQGTLQILEKMLHKDSPLRKIIAIQAVPYVSNRETEQ